MTTEKDNQHWKDLKYVSGEIFQPDGMAGCSFLVKLEGSKMLEPINLNDTLKKSNLKVWVRYHLEKNRMSVCMMGDLVTLDDIQFRK